ncbi:MAG TPA: hypothetical protein VKE40_11235, partial [Gemmataceae bacterium]|nr:hypothetical protein [Gemmataceae bacterium]
GVLMGHCGVPDVAYGADPETGVAVYSSVPNDTGQAGWMVVGGTSASAPQWAALIALANQERAAIGRPTLGRAADVLYSLPRRDFHDITTGGNGYLAGPGYDLVTGLGSPVADLLVPDLAGVGLSATTPSTPPTNSPGGTGGISIPGWYLPGFGWGFGGMFGWNAGGWEWSSNTGWYAGW